MEKRRPSDVTTVAERLEVEETAVTSDALGLLTCRKPDARSITKTAPERPTNQETSRAGDEPAVRTTPAGRATGSQPGGAV